MRVVALEEHFTVPALVKRIDPAAIARRGFRRGDATRRAGPSRWSSRPRSASSASPRWTKPASPCRCSRTPGPVPISCPAPTASRMAREMNDHLAAAIARHPDSLRGIRRAADAEPGRLRRRARARGQGARLRRRHHQRHHRGPLPRSSRATTRCWRRPSTSTCRSTSIRIWRPSPCAQAYFSDLEPGAARVLEAAGWGWHSGDGDPRAAPGAGRHARPASQAEARSSATWARCCR